MKANRPQHTDLLAAFDYSACADHPQRRNAHQQPQRHKALEELQDAARNVLTQSKTFCHYCYINTAAEKGTLHFLCHSLDISARLYLDIEIAWRLGLTGQDI